MNGRVEEFFHSSRSEWRYRYVKLGVAERAGVLLLNNSISLLSHEV